MMSDRMFVQYSHSRHLITSATSVLDNHFCMLHVSSLEDRSCIGCWSALDAMPLFKNTDPQNQGKLADMGHYWLDRFMNNLL